MSALTHTDGRSRAALAAGTRENMPDPTPGQWLCVFSWDLASDKLGWVLSEEKASDEHGSCLDPSLSHINFFCCFSHLVKGRLA